MSGNSCLNVYIVYFACKFTQPCWCHQNGDGKDEKTTVAGTGSKAATALWCFGVHVSVDVVVLVLMPGVRGHDANMYGHIRVGS